MSTGWVVEFRAYPRGKSALPFSIEEGDFMKLIYVLSALLIMALPASSQSTNSAIQNEDGDQLLPGKHLIVDGVPKVPKEFGKIYDDVKGSSSSEVLGWNAHKLELRILHFAESSREIQAVTGPGEKAKKLFEISPEKGWVYSYYFDRQGNNLVYNVDVDGNEQFQFYFYDTSTQKSVRLTDGKSRNVEPIWSRNGNYVVWGATPEGETGMELHVSDPLHPEMLKRVVSSSGTPLEAFDWSPDDRYIIYVEYLSLRNDTRLWLVEVSSGKKELLAPLNSKESSYYGSPVFSSDGRYLYLITDKGSEFKRLAQFNLRTKEIKYITKEINWDIDEFALSPDGKLIAFVTNEGGISKLRLFDVKTNTISAPLNVPFGIISKLTWHSNSKNLAFNFESPKTVGDIYVLNAQNREISCWSKAVIIGVNPEDIQLPDLFDYKSFDGRKISGFIYRPIKRSGKLPVLIEIHGGPEEQFRPKNNLEVHFITNKLGIAKIYPNVRGSSGYGKTFLKLDNGLHRKDALKDIEYLLSWIKKQPDLDGDRIIVTGYSYGGYMSLLVASNYGDKIRGAISNWGPSNLVSFLENTTGWRRDLRRAEYGDERDPQIRQELSRVAPRNNVEKLSVPVLIFQGMNDPRVKYTESSDLVQELKSTKKTVWYVLAKNEGHGYTYIDNAIFMTATTMLFLKHFLLSE
jgi:dipeptidyl aminopeptidase/acylaminoacyl peptidase